LSATFESFFDANPILTIFVMVLSILGLSLLFICISIGFVFLCQRLCKKRQTYNLGRAATGYGKKYEDHGWRYESVPMDEFVHYEREPTRRDMARYGGVPVMLTDERGHSLPYTLRTRARDGTIEKYTTHFGETAV
jgi:hypothetical protein